MQLEHIGYLQPARRSGINCRHAPVLQTLWLRGMLLAAHRRRTFCALRVVLLTLVRCTSSCVHHPTACTVQCRSLWLQAALLAPSFSHRGSRHTAHSCGLQNPLHTPLAATVQPCSVLLPLGLCHRNIPRQHQSHPLGSASIIVLCTFTIETMSQEHIAPAAKPSLRLWHD